MKMSFALLAAAVCLVAAVSLAAPATAQSQSVGQVTLTPVAPACPVVEAQASPAGLPVDGGAAAGTQSVTFTQSGTFLSQDGSGQPRNYSYDLPFSGTPTFTKFTVEVDFYIGYFGNSVNGTSHPSYQYMVFWLANGPDWNDMLAFSYLRGGGTPFEIQSEAGGFFAMDSNPCDLSENTWYHMALVYDTKYTDSAHDFVGLTWGEIKNQGNWVCSMEHHTPLTAIVPKAGGMSIKFGTFDDESGGPIAIGANWEFANMKVQFTGDQPSGPRPRRRQ